MAAAVLAEIFDLSGRRRTDRPSLADTREEPSRRSERAGASSLTRASLTVAGLASGGSALAQMGGGGMGGGGMGGGTGVVDPPVSGPLLDLPVASGQVVTDPMLGTFTQYTLEARIAPVTIGGASASAMVYADGSTSTGRFVAPLIRASPGERVRLRFVNGLPASTATNILGHPRYRRTSTSTACTSRRARTP